MQETRESAEVPERRSVFRPSPLAAYFVCLVILGALVIGAAKALGQQGAFLAQFYMLTPAVAAILTRLFFYKPRFRDAKLGFGRWTDYFKFWGLSVGITVLSYLMFTLLGAVTWDPSGQSFLDRLDGQFRQMGQDMNESLPPGMTPRMMLLLYLLGGLTILNILPGIIMGFGEEFGHRGFMFIELQKINPRTAVVVGGIIWFAWHLPIGLAVPQADPVPLWQMAVNVLAMGIGSICAFAYFAFVYVRSGSIWVASLAHITMNNSAGAISCFVVVESQLLANIGLSLTMVIVYGVMYFRKDFEVFENILQEECS